MMQHVTPAVENHSPKVVCIGETMIMFAPPPHQLIEQSARFDSYLGGAEANVAIGLTRLGVRSGWIGKLPRNALGRKIVNEIRSYGVDTSGVVWTDEGRVGTFFFEFAPPPRPQTTIYDRAGSAAATLTADELDWDYLDRHDWIHLTGITPALSATCRSTVREILMRAGEHGLRVSFDVNYRELVWSREEARTVIGEFLPKIDLLIATQADAEMLAGTSGRTEDTLRLLVEGHRVGEAVMTLQEEGAIAFDGDKFFRSKSFPATVVNRLGAGDAFVAGLLYGYNRGGLAPGLRYGNAMAALKLTIPQNVPIVRKADVERIVSGHGVALLR